MCWSCCYFLRDKRIDALWKLGYQDQTSPVQERWSCRRERVVPVWFRAL